MTPQGRLIEVLQHEVRYRTETASRLKRSAMRQGGGMPWGEAHDKIDEHMAVIDLCTELIDELKTDSMVDEIMDSMP